MQATLADTETCPACGELHGIPVDHFGDCNACGASVTVEANRSIADVPPEPVESSEAAYWDQRIDEWRDEHL